MQVDAFCRAILSVICLVSVGCQAKVADKDKPPLRIIATDAGFEAPDRVAAGLRHIVFENHGSQIHESMLVKLPKGMSADDYVAAVKKGSLFPEGALDYSGPGLTSPGEATEIWLRVDPGQYILICWNNGHAKTTPVHPFTVEDVGAKDDRAPKEDLVWKLFDYRFELSGDLHKGVHVIRVETPGPSMHEVDIYRLHDGKTVADLNSWRKQPGNGPAPAEALGGALDSHDVQRVVWLRKTFTPGRYVLHCEMPVTNTELTHADVGMVREIEIKE
jgi:uncharacterized cupredoxin-like copper-binding protein